MAKNVLYYYKTDTHHWAELCIDYYRTEIQLELNFCYREHKLSDEQIRLLRAYYHVDL